MISQVLYLFFAGRLDLSGSPFESHKKSDTIRIEGSERDTILTDYDWKQLSVVWFAFNVESLMVFTVGMLFE